jgi:hypothetical protein
MILLCFLFFGHPEPSLARVRGLYKQCVVSEDSCKALLVLLKECDQSNEPLLAGYRAGATMMMAKYSFSPWTKWRCFCQGRDLLERSVAADGQNVELIFIRYSVQQHCPWFLHYRQSVQKDRNFIDANLEKLNDLALKKEITEYLGKEKT